MLSSDAGEIPFRGAAALGQSRVHCLRRGRILAFSRKLVDPCEPRLVIGSGLAAPAGFPWLRLFLRLGVVGLLFRFSKTLEHLIRNLVNQFIDSNANDRTDEYGGSLENRLRFLGEVTRALVEGTGDASRVGIRLAPLTTLNGCEDADPETTYLGAAKLLADIGVGYIHIAEADWEQAPYMPVEFKQRLRAAFPGTMIYAGGYTAERAREALEQGWADLIGFGRPFIANPDLPERLRIGAPLAVPARETLFGGDAHGLTDYPTLETVEA